MPSICTDARTATCDEPAASLSIFRLSRSIFKCVYSCTTGTADGTALRLPGPVQLYCLCTSLRWTHMQRNSSLYATGIHDSDVCSRVRCRWRVAQCRPRGRGAFDRFVLLHLHSCTVVCKTKTMSVVCKTMLTMEHGTRLRSTTVYVQYWQNCASIIRRI